MESINPLSLITLNSEAAPEMKEELSEMVEFLDLHQERKGTLINVRGRHLSANYIIRINDGDLDIWARRNHNGFRGPIDIVSSTTIFPSENDLSKKFFTEEGIMKQLKSFVFPYFTYGESSPRLKSLVMPSQTWMDSYQLIAVQRPGEIK